MYGPGGRKQFFIDGREVTAEEYAKTVHPWKLRDILAKLKAPGGQQPSTWPQKNVALAVQPHQVEAANARNKKHGIGTRYDGEGNAIVPDAADYKRLQRLEGVFNKDDFC